MYPLYVSLKKKHCLIVGLGSVGERKLATMLAYTPASVTVLDIRPASQLGDSAQALLRDQRVVYHSRPFTPNDTKNIFFVIAATNDVATNDFIAKTCLEQDILCNCVTSPQNGDVFLPAIARGKHLSLALSTGGASPALARHWRRELEDWILPRERLLELVRRLRPRILALDADKKLTTNILRAIAESPLQQLLHEGDFEQCKTCLLQILPPDLHDFSLELLDDFS